MSGFLRGALAIMVLVLGVFALTMMATVVMILGGLAVVAVTVWWVTIGKKRITKLRQTDFTASSAQNTGRDSFRARVGRTIEGEFVKEP